MVDEVNVDGRRLALAIPLTYMNLSGEAVAPLVRRHGIDDPHHLVIVHDELDLEVGRIKLKLGGGLAGNNGLKSIRQHLHTDDFARVRIGIGKPNDKTQGADHVLKRPGKGDRGQSVGSLLMGIPDGSRLRYVGRVGSGFSTRELVELRQQLDALPRKTSPFEDVPAADASDARWVSPRLVGEVTFGEWTGSGKLRHPVWRGWRLDKSPADVVLESD